MDCQLPNNKPVAIFCLWLALFCFAFPCPAREVDVDAFGLTYHLNPKGYVHHAPLKLDEHGAFVFNPGLGLGYDFRDDRKTEGWSFVVHGGMFENCDNHPFSFAGAGGRYRKFFSKKNFYEINLLAVGTYGNSSDDKKYSFAPTPYANIGIGHDYGKYSITYYLSFIPKGSDGSITSSTSMLFASMAISF